MNERIEELAKEAGFFPERNWDHTGWHAAGHNDLFEKFAELIVRECAEIAKHYVMNISTYADADFVEKQITEHFGVKE
jgi:hypothetical protein